jgi:AcrR family transcriptional regulator
MTTRTERMSAAERREQLLDVTKSLAVERGFHALSIEAVAREAGITRPIVYGHFGDLPGLLDAMFEREMARALTQLAAILPECSREGDPRDALIAALRGYLEAVAADPLTWRLVLMPPEGAPKAMHERIRRGRDAVVGALTGVVETGLVPGRESPDPDLTARMLSALSDEAARLLLTDPAEYTIDRLVDHARWMIGQIAPQ